MPYFCSHCGQEFEKLTESETIPTHDYPKPCRCVCHGAWQPPLAPAWKDNMPKIVISNPSKEISHEDEKD